MIKQNIRTQISCFGGVQLFLLRICSVTLMDQEMKYSQLSSVSMLLCLCFRIAVFSITVLHDERIVVVAEQRPDSTEEDSFQWMSRVLQVHTHTHTHHRLYKYMVYDKYVMN